jgi:hypothetical protein
MQHEPFYRISIFNPKDELTFIMLETQIYEEIIGKFSRFCILQEIAIC